MMSPTELQSAFNQKLEDITKEDLKDWLNNYKKRMNLSSAAESKIEKLYHEVNVFRKLFQISLTDFLSLSVEEKSRLLKRFLRDHRSDSDMWLWYMGLRDSELLEIIMESVDEKWKDEAMFYVTDRIGKSGNANGLTEKQAKEIIQKIKAI